MKQRYRVRKPAVIHEVFEDEVVIVNLDSGDYFSVSDAGVACWNCLLAGCSVEETVDFIAESYSGELGEIKDAVRDLIKKLEAENLVVADNSGRPAQEAPSRGDTHEKPSFVPPLLNRYSDMRDLLLIDPIHDVDESGWPQVKDEADDSSEN